MVSREHIENFLRINSVEVSASDEEIRQALTSANWPEDDVESAIRVLRGGVDESKKDRAVLNQVLRSETAISAEAIHSLLGVDIELHRKDLARQYEAQEPSSAHKALSYVAVMTVSVVIALVAAVVLMYTAEIGPFYSGL